MAQLTPTSLVLIFSLTVYIILGCSQQTLAYDSNSVEGIYIYLYWIVSCFFKY